MKKKGKKSFSQTFCYFSKRKLIFYEMSMNIEVFVFGFVIDQTGNRIKRFSIMVECTKLDYDQSYTVSI